VFKFIDLWYGLKVKKVYVGMVAEIVHSGHINLLLEASKLGEVTVGLLTDKAVSEYKEIPVVSFENRKNVLLSISYVKEVVEQHELDYSKNLRLLKPDYVVHGDDWNNGVQSETRAKVLEVLKDFGGALIEIPYTKGISTTQIKTSLRNSHLNHRVRSLRTLLSGQKRALRFIDLHNGLSGLIAEHSFVIKKDQKVSFDGMWASSLTDSTSRGKPDIEAVDLSSRVNSLQDVLECTTKPIIFDGDTGGKNEHFAFSVRALERNGVSAVIIEDKFGLKRNSLLEFDNPFLQEDPEIFAEKILVGKKAQTSSDFMIIARIESLILGKPVEEALNRAKIYVAAGADGIMIHSRNKSGEDAISFIKEFRKLNKEIPIVIIPTSFSHISESEFWDIGANIVIYANHLLRASYPAMKSIAEQILLDEKAVNCESKIMSMKEILNLIPGG
jgi:phosphoenolpyruvate phosphomutase